MAIPPGGRGWCYNAFSVGMKLVDILQVAKRTNDNTLYFLNKWRRRQTMGFGVVGSNPAIHQ